MMSQRRPAETLRILLVSANSSRQPLDIDEEFARIHDRLRHRTNLRIVQRPALTLGRLQDALLDVRPHVLHISSHGEPGFLLFRPEGDAVSGAVPTTALVRLLRALRGDLRLVVLNACESLELARDLVTGPDPVVDWAIGMAAEIDDADAIEFSSAFYDSLAASAPIGNSFEAALAMLEVRPAAPPNLPTVEIPRLVSELLPQAQACALVSPPAPLRVHVRRPRIRDQAALSREQDDHSEQHRLQLGELIQKLRKAITSESIKPDRSEARLEDLRAELAAAQFELRDGPRIKPGEVIDGRYHIVSQIGLGGFATVFRAHDELDSRDVALKVLHANLAERTEIRERFFGSAQQMMKLHSAGAVEILVPGATYRGHHYVVMELLAGSFRDVWGRLSRLERLDAVVATGRTLATVHERGIVHRDVRPDNILLDSNNHARLTDFDIAHFPGAQNYTQAASMGVYRYTAPEQMDNARNASAQSDIYSLALVAVFALTGTDPDLARLQQDRYQMIERLDCPRRLQVLLARALALDPRDRFYATALHFADDLAECIADQGTWEARERSSPSSDARALLRALERVPDATFEALVAGVESRSGRWRCRCGTRIQRAFDLLTYAKRTGDDELLTEIRRCEPRPTEERAPTAPGLPIENWDDAFTVLCLLPPGCFDAVLFGSEFAEDIPPASQPQLVRAAVYVMTCATRSDETFTLHALRELIHPFLDRAIPIRSAAPYAEVAWIHKGLEVGLKLLYRTLKATPPDAFTALRAHDYGALRTALDDLAQQQNFPLALLPALDRASRLALRAETTLARHRIEPSRDNVDRFALYATLCGLEEEAWAAVKAQFVLPCMIAGDRSRAAQVRQLLEHADSWCLGALQAEARRAAKPAHRPPSTPTVLPVMVDLHTALEDLPDDLFKELLLRIGMHEPRWSEEAPRVAQLEALLARDTEQLGDHYARMTDELCGGLHGVFSGSPLSPEERGKLARDLLRFPVTVLTRIWDALGIRQWYRMPDDAEHNAAAHALTSFIDWLQLSWWQFAVQTADGDCERLIELIAQQRSARA